MNYTPHAHQYSSGRKFTHTHLLFSYDADGHTHDYLQEEDDPSDTAWRNTHRKIVDAYQLESLFEGFLGMAESMSSDGLRRIQARYDREGIPGRKDHAIIRREARRALEGVLEQREAYQAGLQEIDVLTSSE